jgi:voltage-gated potassium channel Kch
VREPNLPADACGRSREPASELAGHGEEGHVQYKLAELAEHNAEEIGEFQHREHGSLLWIATFTLMALVALGLATYGHYRLELNPHGQGRLPHYHWYSAAPLAFLDAVKLFPGGFPGHTYHRKTIEVAEWLAAIVSLSVTGRLLYLLYADHVTRLRAGRRTGHSVVCGIGEKGVTIVHALRAQKDRVSALDLEPDSGTATEARSARALVLRGDALHTPALRAVAAGRARRLVCASGDDDVNAAIASKAMALAGTHARNDPLELFVHIANPELAALVRPRMKTSTVQVQVINVDEQQARRLAHAATFLFGAGGVIVVVGETPLVRPLAVELSRVWHAHARAAPGARRLAIVMINPRAQTMCEEISSLYPAVAKCVELVPIPAEAPFDADALACIRERAPALVFVCLPTVAERTALALRLRHPFADDGGPTIVVPVYGHEHGSIQLLAEAPRIVPGGLSRRAVGSALLRDSSREALAEAVHAEYLTHLAGTGETPGRAGVPWERLPEEFRDANRRHADGLACLLGLAWLELVPRVDWDAPIAHLDEERIESLAELEHMRWCFERERAGYRFAPQRDDDSLGHPLLVPWEDLPEAAREKDRVIVRSWPRLLAAAGFDLRTMPLRDTLAKTFNATYHEITGPAELEGSEKLWQRLTDSARAATRASVDDIGVKAAICDRGMQRRVTQAPPLFGEAEVERLAEREHARWVRERSAAGWRHGSTRDDEKLLHPDLVSWHELPHDRREIDRRLVEAIPAMLARAGLELTEPFRPWSRASRLPRVLRKPPPWFRAAAPRTTELREFPPWLRC